MRYRQHFLTDIRKQTITLHVLDEKEKEEQQRVRRKQNEQQVMIKRMERFKVSYVWYTIFCEFGSKINY